MINSIINTISIIFEKFIHPINYKLKETDQIDKIFKIINENNIPQYKDIAEEKLFEIQTGIKTNKEFALKLIYFKKEIGEKYTWEYIKKIYPYLREDETGNIFFKINRSREVLNNILIIVTLSFMLIGLIVYSFLELDFKNSIIYLSSYFLISMMLFYFVYLADGEIKAAALKNKLKKGI